MKAVVILFFLLLGVVMQGEQTGNPMMGQAMVVGLGLAWAVVREMKLARELIREHKHSQRKGMRRVEISWEEFSGAPGIWFEEANTHAEIIIRSETHVMSLVRRIPALEDKWTGS